MSTYGYIRHDELSEYAIAHHGIKGQKWGIRRFQNPDGSLTAEGMRRYGVYSQHKQIANKFDSMTSQLSKNRKLLKDKSFMDEYKKAGNDWENELKKYKDKDYRKSIKSGKKMEKAGLKMPEVKKETKSSFLSSDKTKKVFNKTINDIVSQAKQDAKDYPEWEGKPMTGGNDIWDYIWDNFGDNLSEQQEKEVFDSVCDELKKKGIGFYD